MEVTFTTPVSVAVLVVAGGVLAGIGIPFARVVDELADRTGIGEAMAGAVLVGATTSLPGLITTITAAADGQPDLAVSNAVGGIAVQTTFLAVADLTYRRTNLEHAAASLPNLVQTAVLVTLIGVVLAASGSPDITGFSLHPATLVLVVVYVYGLRLARTTLRSPMWRPRDTDDTVEDEPDEEPPTTSLTKLWGAFAGLAAVVAVAGWAIARSGLSLVEQTPLSGSVVGALITGVVTSLPELVTAIAAVRIGALTLAVGDIIGGNTFDVLFIAVADVAYRSGSVYHAIEPRTLFMLGLTIVLTGVLTAGLLTRERRGIGFEGVGILVLYGLGVVALVAS